MMRDQDLYVFSEEVELPKAVQNKMESAFVQIRCQEKLVRFPAVKKLPGGRVRIAAAACAVLLLAGSLTAAAAVYGRWSRSMSGTLRGTPKQQAALEENGMAVVWNSGEAVDENIAQADEHILKAAAVTDGGVTIRPQMAVMTGDYAWLSFSVDGYMPEEGEEPAFERVDFSLDGGPEAEAGWVNANHGFYNGIVMDSDGKAVSDDGKPFAYTEDGRLILHYADENGTLEYIVCLSPVAGSSLENQTLHIRFENLGTTFRAGYSPVIEGVWEFELPLSGNTEARICMPETELGDTGVTLCRVELTPISVKAVLSLETEDRTGWVREDISICGIRLKDGTMLPYITDGGRCSADESGKALTLFYAFSRIIDPEQADALILRNPAASDAAPEEPFCIIPLEP